MKKYLAYLFDMDGTLVDSERLKGQALVETCSLFGGSIKVDNYKAVMGESWENVASYFHTKAQIDPDLHQFNAEFKKIYQELLFQKLATNPHAAELLTGLKSKGKKIGVVSSAFSWMVEQILSQLAITHFFDIIISKENVTKHKPDPACYLLALDQLALPASEVLVIEDSNSGLLAAQRAKCDSIAFKHEFNVNHDFSLATRVISDFEELLETL